MFSANILGASVPITSWSICALLGLVSFVIFYILPWFREREKFFNDANKLPGPVCSRWNLLGCASMFLYANPFKQYDVIEEFHNVLVRVADDVIAKKETFYRFWIGSIPFIVFVKAESANILLSSNVIITKAHEYRYLHNWLGLGLLTAWGAKWHQRRKLLTPAFHFNILERFVAPMNEHSLVLVNKIRFAINGSNSGSSTELDIVPAITYAALDIICDTAMGVPMNSQNNPESEYVQALHRVGEKLMTRMIKPWLYNDFFYFNFTSNGREEIRDLKYLHGFTNKVIRERKTEKLAQIEQEKNNNNIEKEEQFGVKKRQAFLDVLIEHHLKDPVGMPESGIREEVDTFMFEGHDTTAVSLMFTLSFIGYDQAVQERLHKEIDDVWEKYQIAENGNTLASVHLRELKLLEACIKESLRLRPSVPMIGRYSTEEFQVGEHTVPKGCPLIIFLSKIHRDEEYFPNPNQFIPDRFMENSEHFVKNPYAYVPFSAGPRNCIGQKFALQEEKTLLAHIFRNFKLESQKNPDLIKVNPEVVQRPKEPIYIRFTERTF